MTKKQLAALRRILDREAAAYQVRSGRPIPGQHQSEDKVAITDGNICVLLDTLISSLSCLWMRWKLLGMRFNFFWGWDDIVPTPQAYWYFRNAGKMKRIPIRLQCSFRYNAINERKGVVLEEIYIS